VPEARTAADRRTRGAGRRQKSGKSETGGWMKTFVTFGQNHIHTIDGMLIDKDCVVVLKGESATANREKAFELFGRKWSFEYPEEFWNHNKMRRFFPRGYIEIGGWRMKRDNILETKEMIVNGLSTLITQYLLSAAYEQYTPNNDADKMDSVIADGQKKAKELRRIREEFENVITGIIEPY
jgi:hypothetical protein